MTAPTILLLASTLAFGPGLGAEQLAAQHADAPTASPPTAAEGTPDSPAPEDAPTDDNGWGDEDTVPEGDGSTPPATDAGPAEAPVADPTATAAPANAPGTVLGGIGIEKKPAPAPSGKKGLGLMIAAAGVGAIAWGTAGATAGLISNSCVDGGSDVGGTLTTCVTKVTSVLGLTVLKWIANDVTYGLAPAAGLVRGRYEASENAYSGKFNRNGVMFAAIGGGALGVGIVGKVVLWGLIPKTFNCPIDPIEDYGPCVRRRFVGYFIGQQFMSSSIAAGAGLLAFGIYYNKERKARERLFFRPEQVRLIPNVSQEFTGMTLAGRF